MDGIRGSILNRLWLVDIHQNNDDHNRRNCRKLFKAKVINCFINIVWNWQYNNRPCVFIYRKLANNHSFSMSTACGSFAVFSHLLH